MDIENYILLSQAQGFVKSAFQEALVSDSPEFIEKPKSIYKASRMKKSLAPDFSEYAGYVRSVLEERRQMFTGLGFDILTSSDYSAKSLIYETSLFRAGAIYGGKPLNFCIDKIQLDKTQLKSIEDTALRGFQMMTAFGVPIMPPGNDVEQYLSSQDFKPNGARVDVILTGEGPKIIEINFQWVDGIQTLEGLTRVFGTKRSANPTEVLARNFKGRKKLAVIYLNPAEGSRSSGEVDSLEYMAQTFKERNYFAEIELIDPEKYRLEYLSRFDAFYVNGDPRMLVPNDIPDWLRLINEKTKSGRAILFPTWNPDYDKKSALVYAYANWPELFCPTFSFSQDTLQYFNDTNLVLKGDGFSSRQVSIAGSTLYGNMLKDAFMYPEEYVVQPQLRSVNLPAIAVFDTSANKPGLLKNPYSKFNVWIVNSEVCGTMLSLSDDEIISDKDFNTVPLAV